MTITHILIKIFGNMILLPTPGRRKRISGEAPEYGLLVSVSAAKAILELDMDMMVVSEKISGNTILPLTYGRRKQI